jgi:hypothetical protein
MAHAFSGRQTIQTTTSAWTAAPALAFFPTDSTISSIRIHGGATVIAFSDGNFSGGSVVFRHNVPDLRNYRVQGSDNKNWNNRISSIRIN